MVLDAVRYCHDLGIVHRTLAPENLLLTSQHGDAVVKLAGFSFACSIKNGPVSQQCGMPGYAAPEILRAEEYGTVGCIFFSFEDCTSVSFPDSRGTLMPTGK